MVLPVDGDEGVGAAREELLHGVVQRPVQLRGTPVEVEAVGGVEDLRTALPGAPGGQTGDDRTHRGVAVDDVVIALVQDGLELSVGQQVAGLVGAALEGDLKDPVDGAQVQALLVRGVVPVGGVDRVALCLQGPDQGHMELSDVASHGGDEQKFHGFLH